MRNRTLQTLCGCSSALEAGDVETPDPARFGLTDGSPERCKDRSSENLTDSAWLASWLCMNRSVVIKPCGLVDRLGVLYKKKQKQKPKELLVFFLCEALRSYRILISRDVVDLMKGRARTKEEFALGVLSWAGAFPAAHHVHAVRKSSVLYGACLRPTLTTSPPPPRVITPSKCKSRERGANGKRYYYVSREIGTSVRAFIIVRRRKYSHASRDRRRRRRSGTPRVAGPKKKTDSARRSTRSKLSRHAHEHLSPAHQVFKPLYNSVRSLARKHMPSLYTEDSRRGPFPLSYYNSCRPKPYRQHLCLPVTNGPPYTELFCDAVYAGEKKRNAFFLPPGSIVRVQLSFTLNVRWIVSFQTI